MGNYAHLSNIVLSFLTSFSQFVCESVYVCVFVRLSVCVFVSVCVCVCVRADMCAHLGMCLCEANNFSATQLNRSDSRSQVSPIDMLISHQDEASCNAVDLKFPTSGRVISALESLQEQSADFKILSTLLLTEAPFL